jgi:hypothetical protein
MPLASVALAFSAFMAPAPAAEQALMPQAQTVKEYVEIYFADEPVMIDIASCESHFRQFDKHGNVLKNSAGSSAVGIFQIMSSIHAKDAKNMGYDITTIDGNLGYAKYLYEAKGTAPWNASKACWDKKLLARK